MQATLPKVPGASPRVPGGVARQPGDSYADAAAENKPEKVSDWTPPDVAQWLYTLVRRIAQPSRKVPFSH